MRWLVTGASGLLGSYLLRHLRERGADVVAWSGSQPGERFGVPLRPVDLADSDAVARAFAAARPERVIHAAALARVDACHRDPGLAEQINTRGSALLADVAGRAGARLVLVS